ncbi:MAG: hypothetical protein KA319_02730 [Ferruginibacter sp.]|nr:hypothetical protein [Ferruginibacter sp.]
MANKDIVLTILEKMKVLHPTSSFIESLYNQYCLRGGLSKKQLEGLLDKAQKTEGISTGYVATLEAIILKKPTRERAKATITAALPTKDEILGNQINEMLQKYPQHKRLLFLKSKYDKNEAISTLEIEEVKKFYKILK